MLQSLTGHEARILGCVERNVRLEGRPPTFKEIKEAVGLSSKDHVFRDLAKLEEKGYIRRHRGTSRGIEILYRANGEPWAAGGVRVPILGYIRAGDPVPVFDGATSPLETVEVPYEMIRGTKDVYALWVKGDSMIDALVNEGDIVVMSAQRAVENGEMVAAWLADREETTLKKFYQEGERVRLQPANPRMKPIYVAPDRLEIQGKVVGVIRMMG